MFCSLRRKLIFASSAVVVMLLITLTSGLTGLWSYRSAVEKLDYSIHQVPRRADLSVACSCLFEPLLYKLPVKPHESPVTPEEIARFGRFQQTAFTTKLEQARGEIAEFRRRVDNLPKIPATRMRQDVTHGLLMEFDRRMANLETLNEHLSDPAQHAEMQQAMIAEVAHLELLSRRIPDAQFSLINTLESAKDVYTTRYWTIALNTVFVGGLVIGLFFCGFRWFIIPMRRLREAAARVAQGDLSYRVEIETNDELSEFAETFNRMIAGFQETRSNLDCQVEERSRQLVRSERLAGIGFLAAGVAHEINNPLSAISMASDSLIERLEISGENPTAEDKEIQREYLKMIQTESDRCRQITSRLLDFARGQEDTRSEVDINGLISEVLLMVRPMGKYRDRKITFHPGAPIEIEANGPQIKQVVLNLVANGLESMDAGGNLRINVVEQTEEVIVEFQDEGCGMTAEVIEHLFEPFYTQRKGGRGTGLGLSISHRIVSEHGGTLEPSSAGPGQGSLFRMILPRKSIQSQAA